MPPVRRQPEPSGARVVIEHQDELLSLRRRVSSLELSLREMTMLFQSALLTTNPEIAKEGMVFVRAARKLLGDSP
jgi:hypothetical protein